MPQISSTPQPGYQLAGVDQQGNPMYIKPDDTAVETPTVVANPAAGTTPGDADPNQHPVDGGPLGTLGVDSIGTELSPVEANRANIANPQLPNGATVTPTLQTVDKNLLTAPNKFALDKQKPLEAATVQAAQAAQVIQQPTATVDAATIGNNAPQTTAEQGQVTNQAQVQAQTQNGLSPELKSELDTFNAELAAIGVDPNMTVQGQYAQLMQGFDNGGVPAWAQGAYKAATQRLAARGMSGSTMAGEAISTAIMQAALPIAVQDAQGFKDMKLAVLDKKAQGVFLRAGFIANLDMTNLNNRQQAAVVNAQSFLAMDLKNLDNRQQAAIINTQSRLQTMLADQSAINSAKQFNASSVNQSNQFYAGVNADISKFNVGQLNATNQFNAGQTNAISTFNAQQQAAREEFNAKSAQLIDQANLVYQRNINTSNTALINQANMVNSQNLVSISNAAMANEIQIWRDQASYLFQSTESSLDRANNIAVTGMQNEEWFKRYGQQQKDSFWNGVGNFIFGAAGNIIKDASSDWFSDDVEASADYADQTLG